MTATEHDVFWADTIADEILAGDPDEPIVIKGAVSPSGIPHIGHLNEILRGYFVAEVLRDRGYEVRQIFTADDRDALRRLPRQLADADWSIVELGDIDAGALGRNLGVPYARLPDPFGSCHESYGGHFTALLRESAEVLDVPVEFQSIDDIYTEGAFDEIVRELLAQRESARDLLAEYQDGIEADYVPFMPICEACGKITTGVQSFDLGAGTVSYVCSGLEAGDQAIEGCGHEGTGTFRDGKLSWRFEWPAGWRVLGVDFEPFGKDHAEGSWPSGEQIARELLDIEPPVPMVYEWFTLNGEALSSSSGNVVTVPDLLELVEPEVVRYFFVKNPRKQRDLDLSRIDQLVDEFDRFEALYFDEADGTDEEQALAKRAYPFVVSEIQPERVRLPYTFAAVLGMTDDPELRRTMARREGHITSTTPEWAIDAAMERVERARRWADRMNNEYDYRIKEDLPDVDIPAEMTAALDELAAFIASVDDGDAIQSEIYEIADRHDLEPSDFFAAGYQLFFGQPQGPRLGPFLADLDTEFVVQRLRRTA